MTKHTLVKYDMKLPNKSLMISLTVLGGLLIALGVGMFVITVIQFFNGDLTWKRDPAYNYYYSDGKSPFLMEWYYGVIVFVIGIVLTPIVWSIFEKHYREVNQGVIISRDTRDDPGFVVNGVGYDPGLEWTVLIEGYTHANELRQQWHTVNAGWWQDAKVGQYVSFDE